jgi:hypothetical protein
MRSFETMVRRDDGIAMPLVMGVIAVLTVISITSFALASNALNETTRTQGETVAFQIANAGVDAAIEQVYRGGFIESNFPADGEVSDGAYVVSMEQLDNSEYQLTSVGTDVSGFTETIVVRFFYINLWEMIFAAGNQESLTAGGGGIAGNTNVTGPFYVRGSVEMSGGSYVHKGPLFVDGTLTRQGNANLGTEPMPIQLYVSGAYPEPSAKAYYTSVSQSVPRIDLPRLDTDELLEAAQKAQNESVDNVMGTPAWSGGDNYETVEADPRPVHYDTVNPPNSGGFTRRYARQDNPSLHQYGYKYIGAGSEPSEPGAGTTGLVIGPTSFGAWYGNGYTLPEMNDDFAYDAGSGTLWVEGTVFVDGPVTIDRDVKYRGNGTIVANGDVTIQGLLHPDNTGSTEAERRKMGPRHVLGIATPANMTVYGQTYNEPYPSPSDPPKHACALYAGGRVTWTTNNYFIGSIVAGHIHTGNNNVHMVTDPDLPDFLPDSLPGRDAPILTKGAWARQ